MAEWLERWLSNHKVSSSNLSVRKIFSNFKSQKHIVGKLNFGNRTMLSRNYVY